MPDVAEQLREGLRDRYAVDRELGRGGMAIVFLADDVRHGRKVALKVLRPDFTESIGVERFQREIRTAAQLNHPNILSVLDSGEVAGFLFYVTPFIEGASLRERLDAEKQLPVPDAVRITMEVADALAYAHERGVVHRDIKPENILFQAGHALVADFGIAAAMGDGSDRLTQTGMAIGTPNYMSPEQATGESRADPRSDLYSLAAVTYEMLLGVPPHVGPSPQATLARRLVEPPQSIRVVRDTVPVPVEAAVLRALARSPVDRFQGVRDFAAALTADSVATTLLPARPSRRPRAAAVGAIGAIAGVAVIVTAAVFAARTLGSRPPVVEGARALTSDPGAELFPSLSPDGQWVVYSRQDGARRHLFLMGVGGRNAIPLAADSTSDDDQPAFSPDGAQIAFRSSRDGGGIFVMGKTGESVRRVTRTGYRPTWAPNADRIAYVTENIELIPQNTGVPSELWMADVSTGATHQLPARDAVQPSWSPHGHRIAYTLRSPLHGVRIDIWTIGADGGDAVQVTDDAATDWNATWAPDGRYLYFVSDRGGSMNLWRVRIDEKTGKTRGEPEAIVTPATSLAHISFAADGKHLAYSSAAVGINIQRARFDPEAGTFAGDPTWITNGSRRWSSPDPSPDGSRVAFYDLDHSHLYVADADGGNLRQITSDSASDRVARWSPDGAMLAFYSNRGGPAQLWHVRPDGSELRAWSPTGVTLAAWSTDGKRLAGASPERAGTAVLFDADDGNVEHLPPPPKDVAPFAPNSFSPDDRVIAGFIGFGDVGIVTYDRSTRRYERLTSNGGWPVWLPDGRRMLYVAGGRSFYVIDRASRRTQKVFSVGTDVIGPPRLTRDGKTVYFTRRMTEVDIWLLTLK